MNEKSPLFEIVDRYVDKRGRVDQSRVHSFRLEVTNFYSNWTPPKRDGEVRLCTNLRKFRGYRCLASSTATLTDADLEAEDAAYEGDANVLRFMRRATLGPLLYADQLVDVDPLSFEPHFTGSNWIEVLTRLSLAVDLLRRVRPLVEAGILVLAPLQDQDEPFDPSLDAELFSEYLTREGQQLDGYYLDPHSLGDWGWYLRDALRTAQAAEASLVPQQARDWHYINYLLARQDPRGAEPSRVVSGLLELELPLLAGASVKTLLAIRRNEDAFEDWRAALRSAARTINYECTSEHFRKEAKQVYEDLLIPHVAAVNRTLSRSRALRTAALDQPLRLVLGAGTGLGASAALGLPLAGVVASTIASAFANIAYSGLKVEKPKGIAAVLSMLDRER